MRLTGTGWDGTECIHDSSCSLLPAARMLPPTLIGMCREPAFWGGATHTGTRTMSITQAEPMAWPVAWLDKHFCLCSQLGVTGLQDELHQWCEAIRHQKRIGLGRGGESGITQPNMAQSALNPREQMCGTKPHQPTKTRRILQGNRAQLPHGRLPRL